MIHDLNTPEHKTVAIKNKLYYVGEIGEEIKGEIGEISESKPLQDWVKIIKKQLQKYNEDFDLMIEIQEREVLSFIKVVQG